MLVPSERNWNELGDLKTKLVWYLGGLLILSLTLLGISCSGFIEPPAPTPPVAVIAPPAIPHPLEGRSDCLICHEKGVGGAPQFPASHQGRPSDVCITCHFKAPAKGEQITATIPHYSSETTTAPSTSPAAGTTPQAILASGLYASRCAACHGANRQGTPGFAPALTPGIHGTHSDTEMRDAISNGISGTAMPAFKDSLTPEEIDALVQFIKSTPP